MIASRVGACDACGGGAMYNGFGFMPWSDRPMLSMSYRQVSFLYPTGLGNGPNDVISDRFLSCTASLYWMPVSRVRMAVSAPIRYHTRWADAHRTDLSGIGDLRYDAEWNIWNSEKGFWMRIGGGFNAPTGKFMARDASLKQLPAFFQLGRGAWGGTVRFTSAYVDGPWTFLAFTEAGRWATNEQGLRAGGLHRFGVQAYKRISSESCAWLPQAGFMCDTWNRDEVRKEVVPGTEGSRLSARLGVMSQFGGHMLTLACDLPLRHWVVPEAASMQATLELVWAWQWAGRSGRLQEKVDYK